MRASSLACRKFLAPGLSLLLVAGLLLVLPASVLGAGAVQWTANGVVLRKIAGSNAEYPTITPDGSGGAIVTWYDNRSGASDIYAQRVNALGAMQWTANGVSLRNIAGSNAQYPTITSDGQGGAIVTWEDGRSGVTDIYAQRVSALGVVQWAANGVALRSIASSNAFSPTITSDGQGGAIVTWYDNRSGASDIYAQRVNTAGAVQWTANGVVLRSNPGSPAQYPTITPDGSGGAIVTWQDGRSGWSDIYAQRVSAGGAVQWTANGVALRNIFGSYANKPTITSDGQGGAIVTWHDNRSGASDIYAQRVNALGAMQWTANGVSLRNIAGSNAQYPTITSDGSGGAIVTWHDDRSGFSDIYAQRVSALGAVQWAANGVALRSIAGSSAQYPTIVSDGQGGAIVTWHDGRSVPAGIYAQRVNTGGAVQWAANGVALRSISGLGAGFPTITPSGSGSAIVTWYENRSGDYDIYAQRISTTYSITVTQNAHGTITPAGTAGVVTVNEGTNQAFTIKPDPGYHVSGVRVDGASVGALASYTFKNVTANHTITATFVSNSSTWYLAEGTTTWGFSTYITIQNPNASTVTADLTYMTAGGPVDGGTYAMPKTSQLTVNPADVLGTKDFSTKVSCKEGKPIAVDRTMTWNAGAGEEAHNSVGVTSPAKTWYLPEGSSNWGFECWLLIQNPNSAEATCQVTYMIEGEGPQTFTKNVPAQSRASFSMADDIGSKDASIKVTSDRAVIPERAMYRNSRREGHDSIGTTAPAKDYYLAEGATGYDVGYITYVLVQNPQDSPTDVQITYMTGTGEVSGPSFQMPANSRKTIRVNDQLPVNTDVSTRVKGSQPIIAERAMYWDNGTGEACHDSIGMSAPHTTFYLPDGETSNGRETWTLVQNPNGSAVDVELTYMTPTVQGNITKIESIPANCRKTYFMADTIPSGRASIMVKSKTTSKKIMVERAMYWNSRGAGTDTIGGYSN